MADSLQKPPLQNARLSVASDETLPVLRKDLISKQVQDDIGIVYYDVYDPTTSNTLRLYDFEWLLLKDLEKPTTAKQLIRLSKEFLGFEPTDEEIFIFIQRLMSFGLFLPEPMKKIPNSSSQNPKLDLTETPNQNQQNRSFFTASAQQDTNPLAVPASSVNASNIQRPSFLEIASNSVVASEAESLSKKNTTIPSSLQISQRWIIKFALVFTIGVLIYLFVLLFQANV